MRKKYGFRGVEILDFFLLVIKSISRGFLGKVLLEEL